MDYTVGLFQDSFELGNLTGTRSNFQLTFLFSHRLTWSTVFQWTLRINRTRLCLMLLCTIQDEKNASELRWLVLKEKANMFSAEFVLTQGLTDRMYCFVISRLKFPSSWLGPNFLYMPIFGRTHQEISVSSKFLKDLSLSYETCR